MRLLTTIPVACIALIILAALRTGAPAEEHKEQAPVTLLGTLEDWKYPDAKMPDGATMSDGGNPAVQSVKCQTVLTTPDSIEKVIDFYSKKFGIAPGTGKVTPNGDAKSVAVQNDSTNRPVNVQVITVHKADSSTTLVITRAAGEKETHIAWLHYIKLAAGGKN